MDYYYPGEKSYVVLFLSVLDESPRWLICKGRQEEGVKLLRKIAKVNGRHIPEDITVEVPVFIKTVKNLDVVVDYNN